MVTKQFKISCDPLLCPLLKTSLSKKYINNGVMIKCFSKYYNIDKRNKTNNNS